MKYELTYQLFDNVGALTNKSYAFKHRPWELTSIISIDILDSLGSNILFYLYGSEIKRILPFKNDIINEDWISNRTRYFFEGFYKWRINIPLLQKNQILIYISWIQAFYYFFLNIWFFSVFYKSNILGLVLNFILDYELLITSKILMYLMGISILKNNIINYLNDFYLFYLNPFFFQNINEKNIFIFIGINLRLESPILNLKLRKNLFKENIIYCTLGSIFNDNLNSISLGLNIKNLLKILKNKKKFNINIIKSLKKGLNSLLFILGYNLLSQKDNNKIYNLLLSNNNINLSLNNNNINFNNKFILLFDRENYLYLKKKIQINLNIIYLNLFNILYEELITNNINNLDNISKINIIYIINGNINIKKEKKKFIVYQGHNIDINILNVNLILPNLNFLEKSNNYLNIEGNFLKTTKIITKPNFSKNDWIILNAFYIYVLNYLNKIYNFNLNKKKRTFLNSNRFYIYLNNIKKMFYYIKKYSVIYYYEKLTKYQIFYNNFYNILIKKLKYYKNLIYHKLIINIFYSIYSLNYIDKNSKTQILADYVLLNEMRNYINIKYL